MSVISELNNIYEECGQINWNSDGGDPISPSAIITAAQEICEIALWLDLYNPTISPCGDGSIHLYYNSEEPYITKIRFEIHQDGKFCLLFIDGRRHEFINYKLEKIRDLLKNEEGLRYSST